MGAEVPVAAFDVIGEPRFQKYSQLRIHFCTAIVQMSGQCAYFIHEAFVLVFMNFETLVMRQAHQALFEQKMNSGVFDQLVENLAFSIPAMLMKNRDVKAVDQANNPLVLFVDLLDADAEVVSPEEKIRRVQEGPPSK